MKLRLENGNFKITGVADYEAHTVTVNNLPKGLSPEDFMGCVIDCKSTLAATTHVRVDPADENTVFFGTAEMMFAYDRLTGEVTLSEDGSGGGGGSGYSVTKTEEVMLPETTFQVEYDTDEYKLENVTYGIDDPNSLYSVAFRVTFDEDEYSFNQLSYDGSLNDYTLYACEFGSNWARHAKLFLRVRKDGTTDNKVGWFIAPNDTNSHILKVETTRYDITVTNEFKLAVRAVMMEE